MKAKVAPTEKPTPTAAPAQQPQPQSTPAVRRPVNAEGYAPLQQLGTQEPRARRPETETPRRVRTPEADNRSSRRIAYEDVPVEEERSSRGLIAVIIALLVNTSSSASTASTPNGSTKIWRPLSVPVPMPSAFPRWSTPTRCR